MGKIFESAAGRGKDGKLNLFASPAEYAASQKYIKEGGLRGWRDRMAADKAKEKALGGPTALATPKGGSQDKNNAAKKPKRRTVTTNTFYTNSSDKLG